MTPTKREKVAAIIVEAATAGDEATCKKHGIDVRSLQRYRKGLENDVELSEIVASKKAKVEAGWADEIPGALREAIGFLRKAASEGDPKDPDMVHSIAGAFKLLSEQAATWKVLDARLARKTGSVPAADGSPAAGATGAPGRALSLVAGNGPNGVREPSG